MVELVSAVVVGGGVTSQVGRTKVSLMSVTAPVRVSARPWMVTASSTLIEARARMLPRKTELEPRMAELPTCQNTLHSWAPLMSEMELALAVVSVESVWKTKTVVGSPAPSRTSGAVSCNAPLLGPE